MTNQKLPPKLLSVMVCICCLSLSDTTFAEDYLCVHGNSGYVHPAKEADKIAIRYGSGLTLTLPETNPHAAGWIQYSFATTPYELYDEVTVTAYSENCGNIQRIDIYNGHQMVASKTFKAECSHETHLGYTVTFAPKRFWGLGVSVLPVSYLQDQDYFNEPSKVRIQSVCIKRNSY